MHPFLRIAMKSNKRIFTTMIGIAFCLAYLTGTIAIAGGLHDSTERVTTTFDQGPVMIYSDEDISKSVIGNDILLEIDNYVAIKFTDINVTNDRGQYMDGLYAVSIYDPMNNIAFNFPNESAGNNALLGNISINRLKTNGFDTSLGSRLKLENEYNYNYINLTSLYPPNLIFPNDWIMVSEGKMIELSPGLDNNYSFLIVFDADEDLQGIVDDHGLKSRSTTSVVAFFESGIYQVEDNLWSIVLTTGIIVILLVYSIMSIEIQYHKATINNLRGLGAKKRVIIGIFTLKALFITMAGGILGIALGICVVNGVVSISSLFGINTIIIPMIKINSLLLPLSLSLAAGFIGGLLPSIKASKILERRDTQ